MFQKKKKFVFLLMVMFLAFGSKAQDYDSYGRFMVGSEGASRSELREQQQHRQNERIEFLTERVENLTQELERLTERIERLEMKKLRRFDENLTEGLKGKMALIYHVLQSLTGQVLILCGDLNVLINQDEDSE